MQGKSVCIVATASLSIKTLYRGQIRSLVDEGAKVTFVADIGPEHELVELEGGCSVQIPIARKPSPWKDLVSLVRLFRFFLFNRFDLVIVSTPKASLLGSVAARLTLQRRLLFIVRGRAFEQYKGVKRKLFESFDRVSCLLSNAVQFISRDIMNDYISKGICKEGKAYMVGIGSSKGVDLDKFRPNVLSEDERAQRRQDMGIPRDATVFVFCGRVRRDKGIEELVESFLRISGEKDAVDAFLLIVGPNEFHLDPVSKFIAEEIDNNKRIITFGWVDKVEELFALSDIFVFPSYREGFGNAAVEAAASGLPVIAFDVVGCRESVSHNVSGFLCDFGNVDDFSEKMKVLAFDKKERERISSSGLVWARENFDRDRVFKENVSKYMSIINE